MTDAIWQAAIDIWQETDSPKVTGAVVAAAIVKVFPSHDAILASLKLDFQDVLEGIRWYERLKALVEDFKEKPLRTGGIARDWSFGYTICPKPESTSVGRYDHDAFGRTY